MTAYFLGEARIEFWNYTRKACGTQYHSRRSFLRNTHRSWTSSWRTLGFNWVPREDKFIPQIAAFDLQYDTKPITTRPLRQTVSSVPLYREKMLQVRTAFRNYCQVDIESTVSYTLPLSKVLQRYLGIRTLKSTVVRNLFIQATGPSREFPCVARSLARSSLFKLFLQATHTSPPKQFPITSSRSSVSLSSLVTRITQVTKYFMHDVLNNTTI